MHKYRKVFVYTGTVPCSLKFVVSHWAPDCAGNLPPPVVEVSLGILAVNAAVGHGDTSPTLSALCSPDVGLYGVAAECAETYQRELAEVERRKVATGEPQ